MTDVTTERVEVDMQVKVKLVVTPALVRLTGVDGNILERSKVLRKAEVILGDAENLSSPQPHGNLIYGQNPSG
ncbi:MAG: hypothetical protein M1839_006041 [Geoglossum umbratile]|nr:MAG: hypothetical protein M1839_006041 [Geoglossum umbratile]